MRVVAMFGVQFPLREMGARAKVAADMGSRWELHVIALARRVAASVTDVYVTLRLRKANGIGVNMSSSSGMLGSGCPRCKK